MSESPQQPNDDSASDSKPSSGIGSFWNELKRRKVVRVATVYAVVAWVVVQVAVATFPSLLIPDWALRLVIMCVLLGFPIALIVAWAFELTPDGIKVTKAADEKGSGAPVSKDHDKKRNLMSLVFAAAAPTLIFGALAVFFYLRAGSPEVAVEETQLEKPAEEEVVSIAVLPLVNMSTDEENGFFADGIHEDILTNLSRLDNLKVTSRTTMLRYALSEDTLQQIGQALGVNYVVEGSVRRIGKHVRVTIQLIDAAKDQHLWASNFDRELVDVFATQSELSKEISNSLQLEIQPETVGRLDGVMTTSVKAYDLYLKSISLEKKKGETEESLTSRREMLEKAVELDPEFVEAWAALKLTFDRMVSRVGNRSWFIQSGQTAVEAVAGLRELSARALSKAVVLAPENPETLLATAVDHIWPQPESVMAERRAILDRLIDQNPDNAKAWYNLGWWQIKAATSDAEKLEAMEDFEKALDLDPFNARMVAAALQQYHRLGIEENMTRLSDRLLQIVPDSSEARRFARITSEQALYRLKDAFLESADESLIATMVEIGETGDWSHDVSPSGRDWDMFNVCAFSNDPDRLHMLAERQILENATLRYDLEAYVDLKSGSMKVYENNGQMEDAKRLAEKILAAKTHPLLEAAEQRRLDILFDFVDAYWLMGDEASALEVMDDFRAKAGKEPDYKTARYFTTLSRFDFDASIAGCFAELEKDPQWPGFNTAAVYALVAPRKIFLHPRVMKHYIEQGKWISHLAKFFPEYAEIAEKSGGSK